MEILKLIDFKNRYEALQNTIVTFLNHQPWLTIFAIILISFLFERIILFLFDRMGRLTKHTKTDLDDKIIEKCGRPIGNYILLLGFFIIIQLLKIPESSLFAKKMMLTVAKVGMILNTLWLLWRLTDVVGLYLIKKVVTTSSHLDDQLIPILEKTVKTFLVIIAFIYVIQALGYSISGVIAGLGIGGLAVAMASKDALSNFFGSIMILADRPFKVGDWVKVGEDEGTIEQIGFRSTRIRTFPKTIITVPNSIIANISINNFSRMSKRRVKMTIGVTYDTTADQMEQLVENIRILLRNNDGVDQEFFLVNFTNFGASSLDILLYYFTKTTNWAKYLQMRQDINCSIMRLIERHKLSIAFPTQTIHIENQSMDIDCLATNMENS